MRDLDRDFLILLDSDDIRQIEQLRNLIDAVEQNLLNAINIFRSLIEYETEFRRLGYVTVASRDSGSRARRR